MGARYWPIYAATYEAVDARGLPQVKSGEEHDVVDWAAPTCLPLASDKQLRGEVAVNMDDLFQAPPPVQRAFVRTFYGDGRERRVGDYLLYPNTRFFGTGNREQDRAGVYRPETYVNDRITYLEVEPDVDEWASGALSGFSMPERADEGYAELREKVNRAVAQGVPDDLIAFVKFTNSVYEFNPDHRSFLSPRSIERLGRFVRAFDAAGINGESLHETANGTIGEANAAKYMAFRALRGELPDLKAILAGKDVILPTKAEVLYIACTSLLRMVKREHMAGIVKFIHALSELKKNDMRVGVEISVYMARECLHGAGAKEMASIINEPNFIKWISVHGRCIMP
jgi:hypothetical protein